MLDAELSERVTILEQKVEELAALPARVGLLEEQIVQLRTEMHDEFSAVRSDMGVMKAELRAEIRAGDEETRRYMRVLYEDLIERIERIGEGLPRRRPKR